MTKVMFTETVRAKAMELKITPKLLLMIITTLAENPNAREAEVFGRYFKELVQDMKEQARSQARSNNKKRREAGEYALKLLTGPGKDFIATISETVDMPFEGEQLELHMVAYTHLLQDKSRIGKLWKQAYSVDPAAQLDSVRIINAVYPAFIMEFKELASLFEENDLNLN